MIFNKMPRAVRAGALAHGHDKDDLHLLIACTCTHGRRRRLGGAPVCPLLHLRCRVVPLTETAMTVNS
jgi:hypothetical protein